MPDIEKDFVHLARLALSGRTTDVAALTRKVLHTIITDRPDLKPMASEILSRAATVGPIREAAATPIPVDLDSRQELVKYEFPVTLAVEAVWPSTVEDALEAIILERGKEQLLLENDLAPTKSALFVGPPGVGKTLAARWVAQRLNRPLYILDLASVMSSFLGRTGNNIRTVLDYARQTPSVLLLDEFDAIAKRRDDASEIGELKRLVTVLLQAVDEWPEHGLLLAASNHPELLDPAVWRRFERLVQFPLPGADDIGRMLRSLPYAHLEPEQLDFLATVLVGRSFSDIARTVKNAKRDTLPHNEECKETFMRIVASIMADLPSRERRNVALKLAEAGFSQREVSTATGVSRDTIRKHRKPAGKGRK